MELNAPCCAQTSSIRGIQGWGATFSERIGAPQSMRSPPSMGSPPPTGSRPLMGSPEPIGLPEPMVAAPHGIAAARGVAASHGTATPPRRRPWDRHPLYRCGLWSRRSLWKRRRSWDRCSPYRRSDWVGLGVAFRSLWGPLEVHIGSIWGRFGVVDVGSFPGSFQRRFESIGGPGRSHLAWVESGSKQRGQLGVRHKVCLTWVGSINSAAAAPPLPEQLRPLH